MPKSLRDKTISGVFWSAAEKYGNQLIGFGIAIVLARLLEPQQFGLIGMLSIFVGISQTFVNSGLSSALIQKKEPTDADFSTVFFFNLLIAVILYFALFFSAPLIASFYAEPGLINITKVLALILIINAFGLIHNTKIQKSLEFKQITKVTYISSSCSGIIAVILALSGFGVWSLVFYSLASATFRTIFLWVFDTWKPSLVFSIQSFKELFNFSSKILASGLLHSVLDNVYSVVIGKYYSAASLGFYSRAKKMQRLSSQNLISVIQVVTYPALSATQTDQARLEKIFKKILEMVSFLIFPLMIMLAVIAKSLVLVLLGEKWVQVIVYFQLLAIIGIFYPLSAVNLNLLKVKGRSDIFLKLEIIKSIIRISALILTVKMGIITIILGQLFVSLVNYLINIHYSCKYTTGALNQLLAMMPYCFASFASALLSFSISLIILNNYFLLPLQIAVFIITYIIINKLFKLTGYDEFTSIMKTYKAKASKRK